MRTAFVQLGPEFAPLEAQLGRLQPLAPQAYHIEENPTAQAAQRIIEALEALGPGDEFCIASLGLLRLGTGEMARLLAALADRGVGCLTYDASEALVRIGPGADAGAALRLLAEAHQARLDQGLPGAPRPPESARQLLTDDEIEDIRRLARAGLTARRIGLLYRRSPDCIRALLGQAMTPSASVAAKPQRKAALRQKS